MLGLLGFYRLLLYLVTTATLATYCNFFVVLTPSLNKVMSEEIYMKSQLPCR